MGKTGSIYIIDGKGRVVWDVEEKIIGKNVFDLHKNFPELLEVDRKMLENTTGTDSYRFFRMRGEEVVEKEIAWQHLPFRNQELIFAHAVPRAELTSTFNLLRQRFFTAAIILTLIFILFVFLFFRIRYRRQKEIETILRDEVSRQTGELEEAVDEKATLLKEIHHRVKNNLQIIASLLNLQALSSSDPMARQTLEESKNRITAMALIHENIYKTEDFASVDLHRYLDELITQLIYSFGAKDIQGDIRIPSLKVSLDTAIPLGIIVNELITNAIKHAFTEKGGIIRIELRKENGVYRLSVRDNGKGIPEDIDLTNQPSLGLSLIQSLCAQIDGTFSIKPTVGGSGTVASISFPRESLNDYT